MATEQIQVNVAKEIDDVMELVVSLVRDLKAKKPMNDILSGNLSLLMDAIGGIDQLDDEMSAERSAALASIGLRTGELVDVLLG